MFRLYKLLLLILSSQPLSSPAAASLWTVGRFVQNQSGYTPLASGFKRHQVWVQQIGRGINKGIQLNADLK